MGLRCEVSPLWTDKWLKAHLIAKDYTQTFEVGYFEIFSHMVRLYLVQILLLVAVLKQWLLYRLDIKNTFFNGDM